MKASKLASYLLHPIFMPLIIFFISINYVDYFRLIFSDHAFSLLTMILAVSIIFPGALILILLKFKKIESLQMKTRQERLMPLLFVFLSMLIGSRFFNDILLISPVLTSMYSSSLVILGISNLITRYWKISLHMTGIGAATGTFIALNYIYGGLYYCSLLFLILSGILASSRIHEKIHNNLQIYLGFFFGFLCQTLFIIYYNSIISTISIFLSSIASIL